MWQEVAYSQGLERESGSSPCPQEAPSGRKMDMGLGKMQHIVRATVTETGAQSLSGAGEGLSILVQRGPGRLHGGSDI